MTNKEGILGVLGGMGPQATNTFYQRIIDRTQAESDQEHLRVLIWSDAKIPDRTAGILGGREEEVFQHLLAGAKLLEKAGCTQRAELDFHKKLLEGKLPYTIGGGIGQSRLCMLMLRCAHIGEVQAAVWPQDMIETCRRHNIFLL